MSNKKLKFFLIYFTVIVILFNVSITYADTDEPFDVDAKSALLMDFNTGEVIYEKNSHDKLAPASISKIMVLLIAMEKLEADKISLDDEVIVSKNAANMGGSQVFLEEGETQSVNDLIKAISLRSANDASVALAEYISGTEENFLGLMNKKAGELGMKNTNFANTTGLPNDNHYTTAYDTAIMSRELLKYPQIHDWLTPWMEEMKVSRDKSVTQNLVNTNRLVKDYEGANGIKTGSTNEAGFCLAASAKRDNLQLISVVFGCESSKIRFEESKKLLDFGFNNYDLITIARKGEAVGKARVKKGNRNFTNIVLKDDSTILVPKNYSSDVEKEVIIPDTIEAPVEVDEPIGELVLQLNGKVIDKIDLVSEQKIRRANVLDMIKKIIAVY